MISGDSRKKRGEWSATTAAVRGAAGPTRRRVLASVGVAAAVALAGCSGGDADTGGGETSTDGGDRTTADVADDGGSADDPTDAGADSGDAFGEEEGLALYRFTGPERYEFETVDGLALDGATGTLVVDVVEADGEEATVDLSYEAGDYAVEDTVAGPIDEMGTTLGLSSAGGYLFSMGSIGIQNYLQSRSEVTVGDAWEAGTTERVRTEITGTKTVAGVDGYQFVTTLVDSEKGAEEFSRGVYSPELQLLAEVVMEDEEGTVALSKRLVDYERR